MASRARPGHWFLRTAAMSMAVGSLVTVGLQFVVYQRPDAFTPGRELFSFGSAIGAAANVLVALGVLGLWFSGVCGTGWLGRGGLVLAILGHVLLVTAQLSLIAGLSFGPALFPVADPLAGIGLIIAGIGTIRASRLQGWRRFTVLAMGAYVPVILIPAFAVTGGPEPLAIAGWGLCGLAVAIALWQYMDSTRETDAAHFAARAA